jgi:hypothetical protein
MSCCADLIVQGLFFSPHRVHNSSFSLFLALRKHLIRRRFRISREIEKLKEEDLNIRRQDAPLIRDHLSLCRRSMKYLSVYKNFDASFWRSSSLRISEKNHHEPTGPVCPVFLAQPRRNAPNLKKAQ